MLRLDPASAGPSREAEDWMTQHLNVLPPLSFPLQRRRQLDRAWLAFVEEGAEPEGLDPAVVQSWRRAREIYGIDPTLRRAGRSLGAELLDERRRRDPAWRLARPILDHYATRLGSARHVLAYFDAAGWMLSIQGHPEVVEGVAEINFAPGASWSEESAGTNGPGTAIREGRAVEIFASEHFVEAWHCWTCAGAPVFAPSGGPPIGLVDITGPWEAHSPQALALAQAIAREVEQKLVVAQGVRDEVIRFAFQAARGRGDALVAVDGEGRILAANGPATTRIGLEAGRLPPDLRSRAEEVVLGSGHDELVVEWRNQRIVAQPVLHEGCPVGAVIRAEATPPSLPRSAARRASAAGPGTARAAPRIIFESDAMRHAIELVRTAARTALPVVISGESGTGKELFARAIHAGGPRAAGALVAVNCGSIPASLVEAELFGYEPGTFTGGRREGNPGKFEEADGGTLFLDEVGELSHQGQTALLRVLQEREVVRLGGSVARSVDARVIAATHRDLRADVAAGRFREDLYYRLDVLSIQIPPLRQRSEDVPAFALAFLEQAEAEVGRSGLRFADDAIAALQACAWPGNVRQLRNVVLRAAATAAGPEIRAVDLPAEVRAPPVEASVAKASSRALAARGKRPPSRAAPAGGEVGGAMARAELVALLERHRWNLAQVAKALGVTRMTVYRKLDQHGLSRPRG